MQLSYSLARDEFTTALEAVVGSMSATDMHRGWTRRLRLVPWIDLFVGGLGTVAILIVEPVAWRGLAMFWIVLLVSKAGIGWFVAGNGTAQLGVSYDPRLHSDVLAEFDTESASYSGPEHRLTWNWAVLKRFHELPEMVRAGVRRLRDACGAETGVRLRQRGRGLGKRHSRPPRHPDGR